MSKNLLKIEPDYNFALIALVSAEKDYRLVYFINQFLNFEFKRIEDWTIDDPKTKTTSKYIMYQHFDDLNRLQFNLFKNKCNNGILLPELKEADFVLQINGNYDHIDLNGLIIRIKKISQIVTAFMLNVAELKSKNNILTDY